MRWRCQQCRATFRHYPPGVAPRKRYLPQAITSLCRRYAEEPRVSYRNIVRHRNRDIRYRAIAAEADWSEARKEREEARALSPSTVWRWIGFLAAMWVAMRKSKAKHCADRPALALRPSSSIRSTKSRSRQRNESLHYCLSCLSAIPNGKSFTGYATLFGRACG